MPLCHMIYVSRAAPWYARLKNFEMKLSQLSSVAAKANQGRGVTGLLLYNAGHFLQVLEGEREAVDLLFQKIRIDMRHEEITRLAYYPIKERVFERWNMGLLDFSAQANLDPAVFEDSLADLRNAAYGGATTVRSAVLKLLRTFQSYDECREVVPSALRSERLIVAHPC